MFLLQVSHVMYSNFFGCFVGLASSAGAGAGATSTSGTGASSTIGVGASSSTTGIVASSSIGAGSASPSATSTTFNLFYHSIYISIESSIFPWKLHGNSIMLGVRKLL